jgi:ketosteroid isomerase-like protein
LEISSNKKTVGKYMTAFEKGDRLEVLSCLTNDVEWILPGAFHLKGKKEFEGEIRNDAFQGNPVIKVTRMTEENNVVITEGSVRTQKKSGEWINLVFCDVFEMQNGKIKNLTSYLMEVK